LQQASEESCEFKECDYYCDSKTAKFRWEVDQIIDKINSYNNITKDILEGLENLSNKYPESIYLLNQIGIAYYKIFSSPKKSIPYFKRVLLIDSKNDAANFCLGSVYAELGEDEKAFSFFKKTWGNQLDRTECIGGVHGYHYFPFQYIDPLLEEYVKALPYLGDRGSHYFQIANLFSQKGEDELYCEILEKGVKTNQKAVFLYQFLLEHHYNNGNYKKAIQYGQRLIKGYEKVKDKAQGEIYWDNNLFVLGDSYANIGEYDSAFSSYKKAMEYYNFDVSTSREAHKKIGDLYYKLKDYNNAIEAYQKSIKFSEEYRKDSEIVELIRYDVECYRSLGWIFFERKKYKEALDAFMKALNDKPDPNVVKEVQMCINASRNNNLQKENTLRQGIIEEADIIFSFRDKKPKEILDILEKRLKVNIEKNLSIISNNWWEKNIPVGVKDDCKNAKEADEKKCEKHPYITGKECKLIDYAYLGNLKDIILSNVNWNSVYKNIFREKKIVEDTFEILIALRNSISHGRELNEDQKDQFKVHAKKIVSLIDKSERI